MILRDSIVVILTISMCSLADVVGIIDPFSLVLSTSLSVVSVLNCLDLLKKCLMRELGIALERSKDETNLNFVLIPMLLKPLSFEDIKNAANNKDPNLYSDIKYWRPRWPWKPAEWATDDLKDLRVSEHAVKHLEEWRSSLEQLTALVMSRPDQVREENVLFAVVLHCQMLHLMTCSVQWLCGRKIGVCWKCG
jgi:hypothetical protein